MSEQVKEREGEREKENKTEKNFFPVFISYSGPRFSLNAALGIALNSILYSRFVIIINKLHLIST